MPRVVKDCSTQFATSDLPGGQKRLNGVFSIMLYCKSKRFLRADCAYDTKKANLFCNERNNCGVQNICKAKAKEHYYLICDGSSKYTHDKRHQLVCPSSPAVEPVAGDPRPDPLVYHMRHFIGPSPLPFFILSPSFQFCLSDLLNSLPLRRLRIPWPLVSLSLAPPPTFTLFHSCLRAHSSLPRPCRGRARISRANTLV